MQHEEHTERGRTVFPTSLSFSLQLLAGKISAVTYLKPAELIYRLTPALGYTVLLYKPLAENYLFTWRTLQVKGGCGWEKASKRRTWLREGTRNGAR